MKTIKIVLLILISLLIIWIDLPENLRINFKVLNQKIDFIIFNFFIDYLD